MKIDSSTTAFITGGAKGIGLATAECILQKGGRVWLADMSVEALQSAQSTLRQRYGADRVYTSVCNVTDDKQLAREFHAAVAKFKHVKVVMNNAGFGERLQFVTEQALKDEVMPKEWVDVLEVCLRAVINGTRLAVAHLLDIKKSLPPSSPQEDLGVIINISSMGGLHPMRDFPIYCAAKHGVVGFSRSLKNLASSGISVNAVCPSFVDTALVRGGLNAKEFDKMITGVLGNETLLTPLQIAQTIVMIIENGFKGAVISVSRELGVAQHFVVQNTPSEVTKVIVPANKLSEGQSLKSKL